MAAISSRPVKPGRMTAKSGRDLGSGQRCCQGPVIFMNGYREVTQENISDTEATCPRPRS